jgi:spore coat protein JB
MSEHEHLRKKIHQYDFSILEAELYLDTHPDCQRALSVLNELRVQRKALVKAYEERFGRYIVTKKDAGKDGKWEWIDSPWPWEAKGEDC